MRRIAVLGFGAIGWLASTSVQAQDAIGQYGYSYSIGPYVARPIRPAVRAFPAPLIADAFEANPLDDGYDFPFGYGEYAVYGRWTYANAYATDCYFLERRIRTSRGYRWRAIRRCD